MRTTSQRSGWVYRAPPTISRFMSSDSFGRLLCGPVGSGKTTGCLAETARRMGQQQPGQDGRRYSRWAIIRHSLKDAKATVLKDARGWFGSLADWRVSESTLYIDYGAINSEWVFIPLDEPDDIKRLLSLQLTGAYINESVETDISILSDIAGRVGRYPNGEFGACTWSGIFADTNMPLVDTDWANFIENPPAEWQVFRQPGGHTYPHIDPSTGLWSGGAENLAWLNQTAQTLLLPEDDPVRIQQGRGYYDRLMAVGTPDYIRRFVRAEFGRDPSGSAVFAESFIHDFHVRTGLVPVAGRLLIVGQDFGRNPWSVICQLDHAGRLMVLEEVPGQSREGNTVGLEMHFKQNLIPVLMADRYAGMRIAVVGDPSGGAKDSIFEINSFDLIKSLGIPAERAPTNDLEPRLRAVEQFLIRQTGGGGAILFDRERCPTLVRAMNGAYKYETKDVGGGGQERRALPEKTHPWSDVADALQYACLAAGSVSAYQWLVGRVINATRPKAPRPKVSSLAWT